MICYGLKCEGNNVKIAAKYWLESLKMSKRQNISHNDGKNNLFAGVWGVVLLLLRSHLGVWVSGDARVLGFIVMVWWRGTCRSLGVRPGQGDDSVPASLLSAASGDWSGVWWLSPLLWCPATGTDVTNSRLSMGWFHLSWVTTLPRTHRWLKYS